MTRRLRRAPVPAFAIALAITVVLAFLPHRATRHLEEIADIVNLPLIPLRDGASAVVAWLRHDTGGEAAPEDIDRLAEEADRWWREYQAARLRIEELEDQLEQVIRLPIEQFELPIRPVPARITGRNPRSPAGGVELNRGGRDGIEEGTIAVYDGVHLIGFVSSVSAVRSSMVPITSPLVRHLRARVLAGDDAPIGEAPLIQLEPTGKGTFRAEAASGQGIAVDSLVVLDDSPAWPASAQAMIIGTVETVETKDDQPLREVLTIRPRYDSGRLASVTLVVEEAAAVADRGAPGASP